MQDQERALNIALRMLERVIIFSFAMTILIAVIYVAGNYQEFIDETQLQLLEIMQAIAAITTVASILAIVFELGQLFFVPRWSGVMRLVLLVIAGIIALSVTLGSSGILVMLSPI